jgi:hypothetical protein
VLANSAVYLLLAKDQRLKAHELKNLERIMRLLTETQLTPDQRARHAFHYSSVRDALDETSRRLAEPSGGEAAAHERSSPSPGPSRYRRRRRCPHLPRTHPRL